MYSREYRINFPGNKKPLSTTLRQLSDKFGAP